LDGSGIWDKRIVALFLCDICHPHQPDLWAISSLANNIINLNTPERSGKGRGRVGEGSGGRVGEFYILTNFCKKNYTHTYKNIIELYIYDNFPLLGFINYSMKEEIEARSKYLRSLSNLSRLLRSFSLTKPMSNSNFYKNYDSRFPINCVVLMFRISIKLLNDIQSLFIDQNIIDFIIFTENLLNINEVYT